MTEQTSAILARFAKPLPGWMRPLLLACFAIGAVSFVLIAGFGDSNRAWRIYHVNWLYWTGLAQGLVLFGAVTTVAKGRWATGMLRMGEASVAFLPVAVVLFLVMWIGRAEVFPWIRHPITDIPAKALWLRDWFMWGRDLLAMVVLFGLSWRFVRHGLRLDAAALGPGARLAPWTRAFYDRLLKDWNAPGRGADFSWARRELLAVLMLLAYAVCMSLIAFDLVMSIAPHWISNLLGGFFFIGAWLSGLMTLALLMLFFRRHYGLDDLLTIKMQHDLAKLCFGFTVFWAYTFFSQFIVIWFGNMPEETSFLWLRMATPQWRAVSTAMVVMCFLLPFAGLMGIKPKKTPAILATFALISLMGLWIDRYVLVVPSVVQSPAGLPLGWQELLITIGFFGLWGLCYSWFVERFGLGSPALLEHESERRHYVHTADG
jgi:hypothetical protein